jgi:hypothetical protein
MHSTAYTHRLLSSAMVSPEAIQSILGNTVRGGLLEDNSSAQATGVAGLLTAAVKLKTDALIAFDGIVKELALGSTLTLEDSASAVLPAVNDACAWLVYAKMPADGGAPALYSHRGVIGVDASIETSFVAADLLTTIRATAAANDLICLLGFVRIKRTADTTVAVTFDHTVQMSQYFDCGDDAGIDTIAALL